MQFFADAGSGAYNTVTYSFGNGHEQENMSRIAAVQIKQRCVHKFLDSNSRELASLASNKEILLLV